MVSERRARARCGGDGTVPGAGMAETFVAALSVGGRPCSVVGGDDEAVRRARSLADEGARVTLWWTERTPALSSLDHPRITVRVGPLNAEAIVGGAFVTVVAEQDPAVAAPIFAVAERGQKLICSVDQPAYCNFAHVAVVRAGPVRIGVSTGGDAPLLARRIREGLERAFDGAFTAFAERVAAARRAAPKGTRFEATRPLLEGFSLEVRITLPPDTNGPGSSG